MKRRLCSCLVILCILLSGCSLKAPRKSLSSSKIQVLSTIGMIDDLVVRIGGDRVDCSVLILGEIDPHSYELVKGDDEKIERAHIVFFNGLNLEHGASLQSKLLKHPHAVSLGDFILKHCSGKVLFEEGQPDPHIWMDISLWAFAITPIVDSLAAIDPEGKTYYETRAAALKQELLISHETLLKKMGEIPEEIRYLVTSHDAFGYFTRAYLASEEERELGTWKKRFAAPEGLSPDGQIGVVDLQRIIDYLEQHHVRVVFPESNVSQDSLRKIVFACQAKNRSVRFSKEPLYGDSMGPKDSSSGHYVGMIEHNGDVLIKEWTK